MDDKNSVVVVAERLYKHVNPNSKMDTPTGVYITTEKWREEWVKAKTNLDFFNWCLEYKQK